MDKKSLQILAKIAQQNPALAADVQQITAHVAANHKQAVHELGEVLVKTDRLKVNEWREGFVITDMTNAGKRGKSVLVSKVRTDSHHNDRIAWKYQLRADLKSAKTYKEAMFYVTSARAEAMLHFEKLGEDYPPALFSVSEDTKRGIDVAPANLKPIVLKGSDWGFTSTPADFSGSQGYDYRIIPPIHGSKVKAAKKLYDLLTKEIAKGTRFTSLADITILMRNNNIGYHSYYVD